MTKAAKIHWWQDPDMATSAEIQMHVLGLKRKHRKSSDETMMEWIRGGGDVNAAIAFANFLGIKLKELYPLLGISERTFARSKAESKPLGTVQTDRLARLARIVGLATIALGSPSAAAKWLKTPNRVLGAAPLTLLDNDTGTEKVEEVLMRIEHGVYS